MRIHIKYSYMIIIVKSIYLQLIDMKLYFNYCVNYDVRGN